MNGLIYAIKNAIQDKKDVFVDGVMVQWVDTGYAHVVVDCAVIKADTCECCRVTPGLRLMYKGEETATLF